MGGWGRKDATLCWALFSSSWLIHLCVELINGWLCLFHLRIACKMVFILQRSLDVLQSGHHPHRPRSRQQSLWSTSVVQMHSCHCPENHSTARPGRDLGHIDENCIISLKISPPSHFTVHWKFHHLHSRICNEKLEIKMMPNIKVKVVSHSLTETY